MTRVFKMDEETFQVDMMCFERTFVPVLTENAKTGLDGSFHYESAGSQLELRIVFRGKPGKEEDLQRLWESLQLPAVRCCTFPVDGTTRQVYAYVCSCKQALADSRNMCRWGSIEVRMRQVKPWEEA